MFTYSIGDVNQALQIGLDHLLMAGVEETSRNGSVIVAPEPVGITYLNPRRRVLLSPTRDSNPFFSFFESLWMLAGNNDIEFPCYFNSTYGQFSDDGKTMHDAYGYRWRNFFGWDQLEAIVQELRNNPTSRRCVLSMWNGMSTNEMSEPVRDDFDVAISGGKAVPCNTHAYFAIRNGELNMTVCNRSNDAVWGAFGANAVHFSFLLEYMAMRVGVPMGGYCQITNNLHVYTDKFDRAKLDLIARESNLHVSGVKLPDLGPTLETGFDDDLKLFMEWARKLIRAEVPPTTVEMGGALPPSWELALDIPELDTEFMSSVAAPMLLAWVYRKWKDYYSMSACLSGIEAGDWRTACEEWIERREAKNNA